MKKIGFFIIMIIFVMLVDVSQADNYYYVQKTSAKIVDVQPAIIVTGDYDIIQNFNMKISEVIPTFDVGFDLESWNIESGNDLWFSPFITYKLSLPLSFRFGYSINPTEEHLRLGALWNSRVINGWDFSMESDFYIGHDNYLKLAGQLNYGNPKWWSFGFEGSYDSGLIGNDGSHGFIGPYVSRDWLRVQIGSYITTEDENKDSDTMPFCKISGSFVFFY